MAPSARERLLHINQAIEKIARCANGKDFTDYASDAMLRDAVERNLTIIAEATLALDEMQEAGVAQGVSQYKRIIGFRIPLTHRYYEFGRRGRMANRPARPAYPPSRNASLAA